MKETQKSRQYYFKGKVIQVSVDTVILPNGKEATRECVFHHGAVAILAVVDECAVLVEQFRYLIGQTTLEIPAGKIDQGEEPKQAAFRELAEETPFQAGSLTKLFETYGAIGFSNEKVIIYEAHDLTKDSTMALDEDEFVNVHFVTKEKARLLLEEGKIVDAKTIIALQYWLTK